MSETAPISLYFDVPKGKHADLEVVARATLEWIEAIRDIASVVAPGVEFEIEFVESEDGSVWLSNMLKAVKEGDRKALASIVGAVLLFFAAGPALHIQADFGDEFWTRLGHEDQVNISEEDKAEIVRRLEEAIERTAVEDRRRKLVREVERDDQINGIGVGISPSEAGPIARIPREMFPAYGAGSPPTKEVAPKDTAYLNNVRVKIIRANLEEGENRPRWRFAEGETKWSADIEDEEFVYALNVERTGLPLAVGQTLVVDVAIDLKFVDGAWNETNRRIVRVREPTVSRRQGDLLGRE
jgi:hypothetical protein